MTDYLTDAPADPSPSRDEPRDSDFRVVGDFGKLFGALSKAQAMFEPIRRTEKANVQGRDGKQGYTFAYAPLEEILRATKAGLIANGFAVQFPHGTTLDGRYRCRVRLVHESGGFFETSEVFDPLGRAQDLGSSLTYRRRYGLAGLLGVSPDDDDDGNAADGNQAEITKNQKAPQAPRKAAPAPVQPKAPSPAPKPPSVPPAATGDTEPAPGTNPANDKPLTPVSEGTWNAVTEQLRVHSYTRGEAHALFGKFGEDFNNPPFPGGKHVYSEETAIQVLRYLQEQK